MNKIITISREFGAGGHTIGKRVAQELGIEFYDRDIVRETAKASGIDPALIENEGEDVSRTDSILKTICSASSLQFNDTQVVIHDVQQAIIVRLAQKGPCVILGRCGDYVLRDRKDVLRVFIYAPVEWRRELAKTDPLVKAHDEKGIKEEIEKTDRNRSAYYNYYTQNRWGDAHNYDLAINAALGRETCVKMILDAVAAKEKAAEK